MKKYTFYLLSFVFAALIASCSDVDQVIPMPEIIAQGFNINEAREGILSQFGNLKVRIQAAGKIEVLSIKERSYEVDLAKTTERSHFDLFGIKKNQRLLTDVTLNFKKYINEKIDSEGQYEFNIEVTDTKGQSTTAKLLILVYREKEEDKKVETPIVENLVEKGEFKFQRVGKGNITGADDFGITWKTIKNTKVIIKITKAKDGAKKIVRLEKSDYDGIKTKEQLSQIINDAEGIENIEMPTLNNEAAGEVFGGIIYNNYYMLNIQKSTTFLSDAGTTVTLKGEYKY